MNDSLSSSLDYQKSLVGFLSAMITCQRWDLFKKVSESRTRYLTVVVENLYQSHNASAVLRSCECFGVQDIHIIENEYPYEVNDEISMGSHKWLNIKRYNDRDKNTMQCLKGLKENGYRIVATVPKSDAQSIFSFDVVKGRFALLFGTEKEGLSPEALEMADECLYIPMYGFTESFNISVSAALSLFHLTQEVRNSVNWQLSESEIIELQLDWLRKSIRESARIEERYLKDYYRIK